MVPNYGTKGLAILGPANFHLQQIQLDCHKNTHQNSFNVLMPSLLWCHHPEIQTGATSINNFYHLAATCIF